MVQSCLGECNQAPLFVLAVRCVTSGGQGGERYFRWRFPENKFTVDFQVKVCVPGVGEGREKQESFYFFCCYFCHTGGESDPFEIHTGERLKTETQRDSLWFDGVCFCHWMTGATKCPKSQQMISFTSKTFN